MTEGQCRQLILAMALGSVGACADVRAPRPAETRATVATIPDSEVHDLRSDATGHEYRISVGYATGLGPPSPTSPEETFPVVYVLDANGAFGTAVETARMMQLGGELPPMLIVGIGYPVARFAETYDMRMRDYTPTSDTSFVRITREFQGGQAGPLPGDDRRSGGGEDFLRFIQNQLQPFIEGRYAADPDDATLVGHSFGGLFGAWVLLTHAETLQRYVLASPGLFWDDQVAFELEERVESRHLAAPD